jgi:RimJ/RimL family protein N-acetyltransferase
MAKVARIETERLLLRERQASDVAAWAALVTDPDFRRYIPWRKGDETPEERSARALDNLMARWNLEPLAHMGWVIEQRSDGQVVGTGGIEEGESPEDGEIDYFLGKPFWGQGYGKEAAHAMARFAHENTEFERLVAYIVPGNTGSIRIAEGLGLKFEREVDYLAFFPDPSIIELSNPITRMYAARFDDLTIGSGQYRVLDGGG